MLICFVFVVNCVPVNDELHLHASRLAIRMDWHGNTEAHTHISGRSFEGVPLNVVPRSLFRMLSLLVIICKPNFGVIRKGLRVKARLQELGSGDTEGHGEVFLT